MTPIIRRLFLSPLPRAVLARHVGARRGCTTRCAVCRLRRDRQRLRDQVRPAGADLVANELVRGDATRAVAEHTTEAQSLAKNRTEAGVSMAPDEDVRKISDDAMARLNTLQGAEFDTASPPHRCVCKPWPSISTALMPRTARAGLYAGTRKRRCQSRRRCSSTPSGSPADVRAEPGSFGRELAKRRKRSCSTGDL